MKASLKELLIHILGVDFRYPVGSIYITTNSTSPAVLFGGTWEQIKGRFLLGTGMPDDNSNTYYGTDLTYNGSSKFNEPVGTTGGTSRHTLTVDQMPSHNHVEQIETGNGGIVPLITNKTSGSTSSDFRQQQEGWKAGNVITTQNRGGGQAHNNLPPFYAVYMWRRTA